MTSSASARAAPRPGPTRDGVRLTAAGTVLLEAARDVLSAVDHAVSQTRQAAGLGRPQLRFVIPADLPESLAVQATSRLRSAAEAAIAWLETALDADFSPIRQRRADAGLGWRPSQETSLVPAVRSAAASRPEQPSNDHPCMRRYNGPKGLVIFDYPYNGGSACALSNFSTTQSHAVCRRSLMPVAGSAGAQPM